MMLVDKETGKSYVQMEETGHDKKEYASKGVAGTALGLGIGAAALWLLNGGLNGGVFGRGNAMIGTGTDAALAIGENNLYRNEQYLERKQCEDYVALLNGLWQKSYNQQQERFSDRQTINNEMFGIYNQMRNGFDELTAKHNADLFALYKGTRDDKDAILAEVGALRTEVAIMKAVRPYQDKLIQCDINNVAQNADFNLYRRTCRMITGELVLPSTPTVTGYPSYNPCSCNTQSTASAS